MAKAASPRYVQVYLGDFLGKWLGALVWILGGGSFLTAEFGFRTFVWLWFLVVFLPSNEYGLGHRLGSYVLFGLLLQSVGFWAVFKYRGALNKASRADREAARLSDGAKYK